MEYILNLGWRILLPAVKLYFRVVKRCRFGQRSYLSYLTKLEGHNMLGRNTYAPGSVLGYGSYLSDNCYFYQAQIGRYTCIGPRSAAICGRHPVGKFVSVHPAFFSKAGFAGLRYTRTQTFEEFKYADADKKRSVLIGNDVWIGADVKIMEGVKVGDGAVVAAGALVLRDVEPYTVVAGAPARFMKNRFTPDEAAFLQELKWWDKPRDWIKESAPYFDDINLFRKHCGEESG